MQTEYIYPALGDRSSPKEWVENGKPDLLANATQRKEDNPQRPLERAL
jgi:trimethylamine--corrinoid protein Co-methyltransferase